MRDGVEDTDAAVGALAARLPEPLWPLAALAYNFWWSWAEGGPDLFASIDSERWARSDHNPVRLLQEVNPGRMEALAEQPAFIEHANELLNAMEAKLARPAGSAHQTVAFFCAEFGIHQSLPIYAGGLGVLAGDFLKEASDGDVPMVGVGLMYSRGSFHQRLDASGWQHEYWLDTDSGRLPAALVTAEDGSPLVVHVGIHGRQVAAQIWRVDVGRVPLYLLDSDHPSNWISDRWITANLYTGHRDLRLAQYALLGLGGVRALSAMNIHPGLVHLNEGHAAFAALELLSSELSAGRSIEDATQRVRVVTRFTTHTPVAAGNETIAEESLRRVLPDLSAESAVPWEELLALGRANPSNVQEPFGLTPFALRMAGEANGVSRLHGEVSRAMWHRLWPERPVESVPITHITNGVHAPTWMAPQMGQLLDRHLPSWRGASTSSESWTGIADVPDEELWSVRRILRQRLGETVRERSVIERLSRGQSVAYAEAAAAAWDDDVLTIGFARRIATYKRLALITRNPERGLRLLGGDRPVQLVIAGRAHPNDDDAKRTVQQIFALNYLPNIGARVVFLEDYDLETAARLVQGCDLWVNLPRPLQEASGTSGMKSALNGGLNLSVLDGWWAEAYSGDNGWAIGSDSSLPWAEQDERDAAAFFDTLEAEVIPLFYERDARGIPTGWLQRVRESMRTIGPRYSATRMLQEYMDRG